MGDPLDLAIQGGEVSGASLKRKTLSDSAECDALLLQVDPPAKKVRKGRSLKRHPCIHVAKGNTFWGFVKGKGSRLELDSGSSNAFTFMSNARRLGLVTGTEPTIIVNLDLWDGSQEVEVIDLDDVEISLAGGVTVRTALMVMPERLEKYYDDAEIIMLDCNLLRRGAAIQAFGKDASTLHIRRPKALCRKPSRTQTQEQVFTFWVHRAGDAATRMSVLLDTGADGFYASNATYASLVTGAADGKTPRGVCLDLGGGAHLTAETLEQVPQEGWNFVMGVDLLHQHEAVVNYRGNSVTFTVGGGHRRIDLEHA